MKKILLFLLGLSLVASPKLFAQPTYTDLNSEVQHAEVSFMDWDKDGDLDLLVSGETGSGASFAINMTAYLNNGAGVYTATTVPFTPVTRGSFHWNDVNMDGNPDLLENGFGLGAVGAFAKIYTSNGTGTFTASSLTLSQMSPSSGFADFNNDGYVDLYIFGNNDQGKAKILLNDKAGGFTDSHALDAFNFHIDPDVSVVDFDNDKDLDIIVTNRDFDAGSSKYSSILKNNNGVFTETPLDARGLTIGYGSSTWGDIDGDGYLDLLVNGDLAGNTNFWYKLYKNNAGISLTIVDSFHYGQFSTGGGSRFLDWDNDGDLDFVLTGWTGSRQATAIYLNNGTGTFTEYASNALLPGVSESSIDVGDVDNDTDLDFLITGFSGNDFDGAATVGPYNKNVTLLIKNPATVVNVAPTAPTALLAAGNQASVTLTWTASTDATTPVNSLSYNLFLVDATGKWFYFPLADTTTGKLRQQKLGNVNLNKGWVIKNLPVGNYRWGVQAIDNSFMGSTFSKSSFSILANGTLPVTLSSYGVKAEGNKGKIEWSTATEQNNDHFDVERSSDGKNFSKLATVKAKGPLASDYHAYDNNPSNGNNFYRLIQYDKDGKSTDHGIKTLVFTMSTVPMVITYPNPAQSAVGIQLSNYAGKEVRVTMQDMTGKLIHSEVIKVQNSQGYYQLHLSKKPNSGQYILRVNGENMDESLKVLVN